MRRPEHVLMPRLHFELLRWDEEKQQKESAVFPSRTAWKPTSVHALACWVSAAESASPRLEELLLLALLLPEPSMGMLQVVDAVQGKGRAAGPPPVSWTVLIGAPCGPQQKSQVGITVCSFVEGGATEAGTRPPRPPVYLLWDCFIPGDSKGSIVTCFYLSHFTHFLKSMFSLEHKFWVFSLILWL